MSSDATVDRKLSEVKIRGLRRVVGTIGRRERGFAESRDESPRVECLNESASSADDYVKRCEGENFFDNR